MPEPAPEKYGPLRPLLGAFLCYAVFRVAFWILASVVEFLGGRMMAITIPMLMAATGANALSMATFEARGLSDLGLEWNDRAVRNLTLGAVLGLAAAALVVLPAAALGMAHFRWVPGADVSWRAALFMPVLLLCGAMGEEIAFRGFVLQYLIRGWGDGKRPWIAIVLTGALFGWLHNENPGATPLSDVNTALFGILFGCALLRSHDLWLPIGLHFGWNVALPFLGVAVSGLTIRVAGYELVWTTSDLWSGGSYGPEASVLTSAILAILFVTIWKFPIHKGRAWLLEQPPAAP
ncbi:MAG: CPBP family intramembrane glutamic endopeptidase [Terriglobia bacterium]